MVLEMTLFVLYTMGLLKGVAVWVDVLEYTKNDGITRKIMKNLIYLVLVLIASPLMGINLMYDMIAEMTD